MNRYAWFLLIGGCLLICSFPAFAILAGGEFDLPADSPSSRLDTAGAFSCTGALEIFSGGYSYRGSGTALSEHWVLTGRAQCGFQ